MGLAVMRPWKESVERVGATAPAACRSHALIVGAAAASRTLRAGLGSGRRRLRIREPQSEPPPARGFLLHSFGGSPELVVDGECGYVVPIKDARALAEAFEKLYRDPDLRRRMGEAARERIGTQFRNEDTVGKTIALYEELVPNPD